MEMGRGRGKGEKGKAVGRSKNDQDALCICLNSPRYTYILQTGTNRTTVYQLYLSFYNPGIVERKYFNFLISEISETENLFHFRKYRFRNKFCFRRRKLFFYLYVCCKSLVSLVLTTHRRRIVMRNVSL